MRSITVMEMVFVPIPTDHFTAHATWVTPVMELTAQVTKSYKGLL